MFLQKWDKDARDALADYPVFLATSQKSGKDNSGDYIYRTDDMGNQVDEQGIPVTESGRPAAIDHDLNAIAEAFLTWASEQGLSFLAGSE